MSLSFVNEQDIAGDKQYAQELLNVQSWYNAEMKRLNDTLAKKRTDALTRYQQRMQTMTAAQQKAQQEAQQKAASSAPKQTGTVTTDGQPVNAQGNPSAQTVESYQDILNVKIINEWEDRYAHIPIEKRNWYQKPEAQAGYDEWKEEQNRLQKKNRKKPMTYAVKEKIWDLESEIEDLRSEIKYIEEKLEPSYSDTEGEIEQFFAEIGEKTADILNSGIDDEEKINTLVKRGIKNAKELLDTYYYYYPEHHPDAENQKKAAEKEIEDLNNQIAKIEDQIQKISSMYESLNEASYNIEDVDSEELQNLKDYLDAENISYLEDEDQTEIDFDESEIDDEWKEQLDDLGFDEKEFENEIPDTDDILSIEDEDEAESEEVEGEENITDIDDKINEDKVFYVRITDDNETFVGKIYKLFDEGDWRAKIIEGSSETFEKLNYEPDFDEFDIIAFLRENYDDAELISEDEFNDHVEESVAAVASPLLRAAAGAAAVKFGENMADKATEQITEDGEDSKESKETNESVKHRIPTLDDYLKSK